MIIDLFNRCILVILENEGGLIDHPNDPGGLTNMGICKRNYPDLDIKNLTRNQAIEIYFRDYWSPMNLTGIYNENLILQVFDMGVNAGIRKAIKMLQKIVEVNQDGFIGPITTEEVNNFELDITDLYIQERKRYYITLAKRKPDLQVFLAGWLNRIDHTHFKT